MNSIQSQKIGLCIAGTKSRQGGFTPFVISGILAGNEASNMDRVTLVVEKPVYVIKHTNEYILYLLIDRKVKPCDRDTFGVLSIALTIARDMRLADGKSPYTLLKEVYDKFRSDYMESDGNECDRFINKDVNSADFASIMEQYPVEKRSFDEYVTMNPSGLAGTLCVPQEKMADLFRDSQYSEFAQFKEVEIGARCLTTPGLEHLEIPRPVVYSIKVGERIIKETMSRPDDFFDTASILRNTSDIMYDNLSFCLEDLLNAPEHKIQSGQSSVTLDMEGRCIRCEIQKKEIKYSLEYQIEGGTEKERRELGYLLLDKKIKLIIGGNAIEFSSSSPKKNYVPASWSHQTVSYKAEQMVTFGFSVTSKVDDENKYVMVTITIETPKRDPYSDESSDYQGKRYGQNVPATTQMYNGERTENDHAKLPSSNEQPSNKQLSNKAKKRWILLGVCCLVSMCIGVFIERETEWFAKDLTRNDSVQIASQAIKTIPFNSIFDFNTIDITSIENLAPLVNEIKNRYREELKKKVTAPVDTVQNVTLTETKPTETKPTETKPTETKQQVRNVILDLVKNRNWEECKDKLPTWKSKQYITPEETNAITAVLWVHRDNGQYKQIKPIALEKLREKISNKTFNSLEEVVNFNKEIIIPFLSNKDNKEKR